MITEDMLEQRRIADEEEANMTMEEYMRKKREEDYRRNGGSLLNRRRALYDNESRPEWQRKFLDLMDTVDEYYNVPYLTSEDVSVQLTDIESIRRKEIDLLLNK